MIPTEHENLFWRFVVVEMRDADLEVRTAYRSSIHDATKRGAQRSGMAVARLVEDSRGSFRRRVASGWEVLQRVLSDVGITTNPAEAQDLKELMRRFIEQQRMHLVEEFEQAAAITGMVRPDSARRLDEESFAQTQRIEAEIDLLMERLRRQLPASPTQSVFNFHGAVGSVQTGPGATANVTQQLDTGALASIASSLELLGSALATSQEVTQEIRGELRSVIAEAVVEARQSTPNKTKLLGFASAIALSVQTVGSLKPAYDTVKAAFAAIGVVLP